MRAPIRSRCTKQKGPSISLGPFELEPSQVVLSLRPCRHSPPRKAKSRDADSEKQQRSGFGRFGAGRHAVGAGVLLLGGRGVGTEARATLAEPDVDGKLTADLAWGRVVVREERD